MNSYVYHVTADKIPHYLVSSTNTMYTIYMVLLLSMRIGSRAETFTVRVTTGHVGFIESTSVLQLIKLLIHATLQLLCCNLFCYYYYKLCYKIWIYALTYLYENYPFIHMWN